MISPKEILKKYWGFLDFRNPQEEIITAVLNQKDVIALLPTGGGKSVCFQVPALAKEGTCLVISPLIALMQDQVKNLNKLGIKATTIPSGVKQDEIITLFGCGLLGLGLYFFKQNKNNLNSFVPLLLFQASEFANLSNIKILLTFLKIGAILYGSGYVLFAFLDSELVANGWLTRQALIDAVAVGQITPGPVLSTATFIGWQLNGITGAIVATLGIFLPSFVFVLVLNPLMPKMRKSTIIRAILDAVNVAAVALIIAVCINMAKDTLVDWRTIVIAIVSLIVVFGFKKLNNSYN